jgi:hypothetical protein
LVIIGLEVEKHFLRSFMECKVIHFINFLVFIYEIVDTIDFLPILQLGISVLYFLIKRKEIKVQRCEIISQSSNIQQLSVPKLTKITTFV